MRVIIDAFKIGILLDMKSNALGFLSVLGSSLGATEKQVKTLTGNLGNLHAAGILVGFGLAAGAVKTTEALIKHGAAVANVEAKMRALGMTEAAVMRARNAATSAAFAVPGTTIAGNENALIALRGVLPNSKDANAALPAYLRASRDIGIFNDQHGTHKDAAAMLPMIKMLENKGSFMTNGHYDLGKVNRALASAEAALELSHGNATGQNWYRFTRMAGPAASMMSTQAYIKDSAEIMMGLGPTGGRGMGMAAKTFIGGQVTKAQVGQLEALGLINPRDVLDDHGHFSFRNGTHVKGYAELVSKHGGFVKWFHDVVEPAMRAHGYHGKASVLQALGSLPVTEQRLFNYIHTNWAQIQKFGAQFDKRMGTDANKQLMDHSVAANMTAFSAAWSNLLTVLGEPFIKPTIAMLHGLTSSISGLEHVALTHPKTAEGMTIGGIGLGAAGGGWSAWKLFGVTKRFFGFFSGPEATAAEAGLATLGGGDAVAGSLASVATGVGSLATSLTTGGLMGAIWGVLKLGSDYETPENRKRLQHLRKEMQPTSPSNMIPQDGYDVEGRPIHKQSWIPSPHGGAPIVLHAALFVDGKKMAANTSMHQAHAIGQQSGAPTRFDTRMHASYPRDTLAI